MKTIPIPIQVIDDTPQFKETLTDFQEGLVEIGKLGKPMFMRMLRVGDSGEYYIAIAPRDSEDNFDLTNAVNLLLPCPPFCDQELHVETA